jgi:hypothetical protein
MIKRVLAAVAAACLTLAASAAASVDSNIATTIQNQIAPGGHAYIDGTHTTENGYFTARVCTSDWISTQGYLFFPRQLIIVRTSVYQAWGNRVYVSSSYTGGSC